MSPILSLSPIGAISSFLVSSLITGTVMQVGGSDVVMNGLKNKHGYVDIDSAVGKRITRAGRVVDTTLEAAVEVGGTGIAKAGTLGYLVAKGTRSEVAGKIVAAIVATKEILGKAKEKRTQEDELMKGMSPLEKKVSIAKHSRARQENTKSFVKALFSGKSLLVGIGLALLATVIAVGIALVAPITVPAMLTHIVPFLAPSFFATGVVGNAIVVSQVEKITPDETFPNITTKHLKEVAPEEREVGVKKRLEELHVNSAAKLIAQKWRKHKRSKADKITKLEEQPLTTARKVEKGQVKAKSLKRKGKWERRVRKKRPTITSKGVS